MVFYAQDFELEYKKFGFHLKIQETYFTTALLGLGKVYLFDGVFFSNVIKKGCKMHGMANLLGDYPLEYLKGSMSEMLFTTSYSTNHRFLYISGIMMFLTLDYCPGISKAYNDDDFLVLLMYPSNFGGLPILPYSRCLYKGDSDLETSWMSLFIFVYQTNRPLGEDPSIKLKTFD